ncbi:MAG: mycothione reductase [Gordonia sp. (in: high G+C Gram-positive bacteria)]|uniref:mycothione reductase n=1 Tax=Gordonia sp. (in: high G+C Gram-positive bacteria) TaxID=84139 RepID=UPI003BB5DACA
MTANTPPSRHVDLAIIGSGSANSLPDERFDAVSIAIFEEGAYGGTCLNVGCIPTKMFVYAADIADAVADADRYQVKATFDGVRWPELVARVFRRSDAISAGGKHYRVDDCPNITVYSSHVRFDGREEGRYRLVTTAGEVVLASEVVIGAGARPDVPAVIADASIRYYTNNDVMRLPALPRRMAILGSGYIASEFAHVFASLGVAVTLIARGPALLRKMDGEISRRFTEVAAQKWDVRLNEAMTDATELPDGTVRLACGDGSHLDVDVLLVATGRTPNGDRLNLDTIGIELTDDGRVPTDAHGRTPARGVWALGDVCSPYQLKHVANQEQRTVQANLIKGWDAPDLDSFAHQYVPAGVFTHPQIATVGLTEASARAAGYDIAVKIEEYGDVAYGWAMEDTVGFCKVIADRATGKLLGVHIMGEQATSIIQPIIGAMTFGIGAHQLARGQYWIHPALTEVLENALLGLDLD